MTPYYSDGAVTIYHGDVRDLLAALPAAGVIVTDPPYGIGLNNDWQNAVHDRQRAAPNRARGGMANDGGEIDSAGFLRRWSSRLVFGHPYLADSAATGWLVWDKEPGFKGPSLTSPVEMAYSTAWRGFKVVRLLWSGYLRAGGSESRGSHPTQKPLALMRQAIAWMPEGTVLDPFMGSGTTLVAAKDLGRRAIGVDIDERWCEQAALRCSQEVLGLPA